MCEVHVTKSHAYLNNHDNSTFLMSDIRKCKFFRRHTFAVQM